MHEISKAPHAKRNPGQLVTEWLLRRLGDTGDGKKAPRVGRPVEPPVVGHPQNGGP